jgi:hypothetical protein
LCGSKIARKITLGSYLRIAQYCITTASRITFIQFIFRDSIRSRAANARHLRHDLQKKITKRVKDGRFGVLDDVRFVGSWAKKTGYSSGYVS